jgi:hypothetical protein
VRTEDEIQKAEFLAKAKLALELTKNQTPEEALRPLIEKGIIDEQGQVILDMRYAMPLSSDSQNGKHNGKSNDS